MYSDLYPKAEAVFQCSCSQNPSKISKSNGCEGVYFSQKNIFRGGKAAQTEPPIIELHHSHFEELAL